MGILGYPLVITTNKVGILWNDAVIKSNNDIIPLGHDVITLGHDIITLGHALSLPPPCETRPEARFPYWTSATLAGMIRLRECY